MGDSTKDEQTVEEQSMPTVGKDVKLEKFPHTKAICTSTLKSLQQLVGTKVGQTYKVVIPLPVLQLLKVSAHLHQTLMVRVVHSVSVDRDRGHKRKR